ncbi:heme/hemin ABC transporter substrate-binding protein [Alteromonas sp. CYL-A6]|uniref:heme/hemin ABC transporter substrate-binding protein n=1 Tax=Alteromonas nitratireducens TaxID=3390813 RepID=UPI0034B7380B
MNRLVQHVLLLAMVAWQAEASERYVTAGGTLTEIVFALGKGDEVVAVDQSSSYPPEVKQLPQVGYYRDLAAEGVLSTGLTHLLALEGSGRDAALRHIENAGIPVTLYPKPVTLEGLYQLIQSLADDLDAHRQADTLIASLQASLPGIPTKRNRAGLYLLSAGERGLIAAGNDTVPQLLFDLTGIDNVASHSGFKAMGVEALAVSQPDFIVAPSHVVEGGGGRKIFCKQPALAMLEAAQQCRLLVMESLLSLGMTPRIADAIKTINQFIEAD